MEMQLAHDMLLLLQTPCLLALATDDSCPRSGGDGKEAVI